jgi:K+:H+ antiporter
MYADVMGFLRGMKPANILLVQASIVILIPFLLWRTLQLRRWFPLGVVQIFTGVLLGPAIFGALAPELFQTLFGVVTVAGKAVNRADGISAMATIAVCLFGFLAGADADKELIKKSGKTVASIGAVGMLIGWAIGSAGAAVLYYKIPAAHGEKTELYAFALAYGLVIAVSALPILALMLRELQITQKRIGAIALASSGIADTMMWAGLSLVVALSGTGGIFKAIGLAAAGGALSIGFVLFVASPILNRLIANEAPESAIMTLSALAIFVASAITAITELHPVLGAFVAGVFLPDKVREMAAHRLDQPTSLVLMPFFFLNTGLRTSFTLTDPTIWILFGVSTFLCVFGKMIGHGIAARLTGENWPFSLSVGLLLQTKGLMGLIVISVFADRDIVSQLMFSAAVLMCMVSTGLTTPAMRLMIARFGDKVILGKEVPVVAAVDAPPVAVALPQPSEQPALAYIKFDEGRGEVPVTAPNVIIGRHSEDDIRINDISVSRHHARLALGPDGHFHLDNLSADRSQPNPILVNGQEKEHATLSNGDKVRIGGVGFEFLTAKAA